MRVRVLVVGGLVAAMVGAVAVATASDGSGRAFFASREISMRDDCDQDDPAWNEVGGCNLRRGDVTVAEFEEELASPLAPAPLDETLIGHQAWRNDPPYLKTLEGDVVRVTNRGGRPHTFTEVAEFGGGFVPELNVAGLPPAPECDPTTAVVVGPGGRIRLTDLPVGNHRFMCCIHPWMRALVKVEREGE
jgi:hypothetical protein